MTATTAVTPAANEPPNVNLTRRRNVVVIVVIGLLVVTSAIWFVAFSSVLGAKLIQVRGNRVATSDQVRAAAAVTIGTPLVRLDDGAVARRVEALPVIASASVRTSFPNTVVITVVERVAVGYLDTNGRFTLVDKGGDQFRSVGARPHGLPLFVLPAGADATVSGAAVASVAAALSPQLRSKIASIQAFDSTAITLLLIDERVVRWGSAARSADKARILSTLLTQDGTRFDVTNPDQVIAH